jgi:hypothetical protein
MFLSNISEIQWLVTSTIQSICKSKSFIMTNEYSKTLPLSKVIDYTLSTKGAFLQNATVTKTPHFPQGVLYD